MINRSRVKKEHNICFNFFLLVLSIFTFALPHPTDLLLCGLPFLSYFAFIPLFILVERVSWKTIGIYGFLYGVGCYLVYVSWLGTFNPAAMPVIAGMYGLYLMITLPLMKFASFLFPKKSCFMQWIVFCAYEYVKTLGFSGFHYGVTAYSHWNCNILIQCVSVIGVFGLSAIITFPSAWIATIIQERDVSFLHSLNKHKISGISWLVIYIAIIIFGVVSPVDYSNNETKKVALIQTNSDPWVGGFSSYTKDLKTLIRLSDEALENNKDIDLVVWPETAFIPRIKYHYQYRKDRVMFKLVDQLLQYIDSKDVPFLIGNDNAEMGYSDNGYELLDYNSALLFTPKVNVLPPNPIVYNKMHLVPFTEHFPFKKQLPFVYKLLEENDTHFWIKGDNPIIFSCNGLKFGSPICFEDTFGYIARRYRLNGAEALVNMSNDAWAKSEACQRQHLAMGVFRTVENRIPSVRATSSGQTVIIDPNGKILNSAEPFKETYIVGDIPVMNSEKMTIYTKYGDYVGKFFFWIACFMLVFGVGLKIYRGQKNVKSSR